MELTNLCANCGHHINAHPADKKGNRPHCGAAVQGQRPYLQACCDCEGFHAIEKLEKAVG